MGLFTYSDILKLKSHPNAVKDEFGRLLIGAGVGITKDFLERVYALQQVGADVIALDSAHGHSKGVIAALKEIKKNFKNSNVIAGNVGTAAGAKALDLRIRFNPCQSQKIRCWRQNARGH